MKTKLFIVLTIALIFSGAAHATEAEENAQAIALDAVLTEIEVNYPIYFPLAILPQGEYAYGTIFPYQASNDNWWNGLVITNLGGTHGFCINSFYVVVFDEDGIIAAIGAFALYNLNEQCVEPLNKIIGAGEIPKRGSVYVYGTGPFMSMAVIGNNHDGCVSMQGELIDFQQKITRRRNHE